MDFHTFNKLEMRPAVHRTQLSGDERLLVDEMLSYKRQFEAVRDATHATCAHELDSFWLRKVRCALKHSLTPARQHPPPQQPAEPCLPAGRTRTFVLYPVRGRHARPSYR